MHSRNQSITQLVNSLRAMNTPEGFDATAETTMFQILLTERVIPERSHLEKDDYGHLVHHCPISTRNIRDRTQRYANLAELLPRFIEAGVSLMVHYENGDFNDALSIRYGRLWAQHRYGNAHQPLKLVDVPAPPIPNTGSNLIKADIVTYTAFSDRTLPVEIRRAMSAYVEDRYGVSDVTAVLGYSNEIPEPVLIPNIPREAFPDLDSQVEFYKSISWFLPRRYPVKVLPAEKVHSASFKEQMRKLAG